jgi:hypothetical protein
MTTVTLDILDNKALNLLKDLEALKIIRIQKNKEIKAAPVNLAAKYSGAMTKQPVEEVDKQLDDLRNEWD